MRDVCRRWPHEPPRFRGVHASMDVESVLEWVPAVSTSSGNVSSVARAFRMNDACTRVRVGFRPGFRLAAGIPMPLGAKR